MKLIIKKDISTKNIIFVIVSIFILGMYLNMLYNAATISDNKRIVKHILTHSSITKENGQWKTVGYTKSIVKGEDHKKIIAYTDKEPQYIIDKRNHNKIVKIYQQNNKYYTAYNKFVLH